MIIYKYSLFQDIRIAWHNWKQEAWLKEKGLVYFRPSCGRTIRTVSNWIFLGLPKPPSINTAKDVICYWTSSGTWGSYELPNRIFVCPEDLSPDRVKQVIEHELIHLAHEDEVRARGLNYEEKEEFIKSKRCDQL